MNDFLAGLTSWALLPLAVALGLQVRKVTPRLPPPDGPKTGQFGNEAAEIRLLVIGDSSAAGVGVDKIEETLAPQLASQLHTTTRKTVSWRIAGANSAIAEQIRDFVVPHIQDQVFTHILLAIGTNDAKNFLTRMRFKKGFGGLLYAIHSRWPDARIYWSPPIDMNDVPALPPVLAFIVNMRVQIINSMGRQLCRERCATALDPLTVEDHSGFAIDGFHANQLGYQYWASHVAKLMTGEAPAPSSSQKSE